MSFDVKKLILRAGGGLLVLLSFFLSTCVESIENNGKPVYTNVEYSEDGSSLTIYLDGSTPVRSDRSLNRPIAILGHDYFEVTFLYNPVGNSNPANYIVARASWELGESAVVSGLYRVDTPGTVYYNMTNPLGVDTTGIPAPGEGLAVLFVGKKFDKTLLAVGTLNSIDGDPISGTNNTIKTTTSKVSFNLNVIKAGVASGVDPASSCFQTVPAQTTIQTIKIGDRPFPFFLVERNTNGTAANITATYTFDFWSATPGAVTPRFNFYSPVIRVESVATAENVMPKYTNPPNLRPPTEVNVSNSNAIFSYNSDIAINVSVTAVNSPFTGVVNFSFSTGIRDNVVFAIIFRVPVYAVVNGGVDWYIRPDYNEYFRELDGNKDGKGGAVLIGVDIDGTTTRGLIVDWAGAKNYIGAVHPSNDYKFTLDGINIVFMEDNLRTNLLGLEIKEFWEYYSELIFYWDNGRGDNFADTPMYNGTPATGFAGFTFPNVTRRIVIIVEYHLGSEVFTARMEVEVYAAMGGISIPIENRFVITKGNDFLEFSNPFANGQNYLLVLAESINLPGQSINNKGNVTLFIVACKPGLELGREAGARITSASGTNLTVYLGKWPFNEPTFAGGNAISPEFFSVNTAGQYGQGQSIYDTMFTADGSSTIYVEALAGITLRFNLLK